MPITLFTKYSAAKQGVGWLTNGLLGILTLSWIGQRIRRVCVSGVATVPFFHPDEPQDRSDGRSSDEEDPSPGGHRSQFDSAVDFPYERARDNDQSHRGVGKKALHKCLGYCRV